MESVADPHCFNGPILVQFAAQSNRILAYVFYLANTSISFFMGFNYHLQPPNTASNKEGPILYIHTPWKKDDNSVTDGHKRPSLNSVVMFLPTWLLNTPKLL